MNAKSEFLLHIQSRELLCCQIYHGDEHGKGRKEFILTTGYTKDEYITFIESLDFEYDSGFGGQEIFATIWYKDGTWSDRWEYDGSEGYQYNICPNIPGHLNRIDKVREQKLNTIL